MNILTAVCVAWLALAAGIATGAEAPPATDGAAVSASVDTMAQGEVRKVDKEAQKLTLRHGAIANLGMPAMTMVFCIGDPTMLDHVQVSEKVRVHAEKVDGQFTATRIEPNHG